MELAAEFQSLVGPSEAPHPPIDWPVIERRLGIEFPPDYKTWAQSYPSLELDGFLWIRHPTEFYGRSTIEEVAEELLGLSDISADREEREEVFDSQGNLLGSKPALPFYPQENGLIPWGTTDNGDYLMWLAIGKSSDWKIVVADGDAFSWQEFDCGFLEFLIGLMRHEFVMKIFPEDFPNVSSIKECRDMESLAGDSYLPEFRTTSRWEAYFRGI
ncbi:SMI1/KNR4 family protein [Glycomyces sp. L485]|uniref:SMI1/KNR4 family protein n=1 Tax=Glycomyces sp. L485 TaxID=2909235 RepID=UPI001F4AA628|nr:SMI1/KNR4 family protein [Glycomyces sp. L485]MCH7232149.1 SMI1/KNR4 family protein [Glycomyces sp. L485]